MVHFFLIFIGMPKLALSAEVCRAPAQLNPSYFWCATQDNFCVVDAECCSNICANDRCVQASSACQRNEGSCEFDSQCCSNLCLNKKCEATISHRSPNGFPCNYDFQCGSQLCGKVGNGEKICLGSSESCSRVLLPCSSDTECCSGYCSKETNTCQATADTPAANKFFGVPCSFDAQCPNYCHITERICY